LGEKKQAVLSILGEESSDVISSLDIFQAWFDEEYGVWEILSIQRRCQRSRLDPVFCKDQGKSDMKTAWKASLWQCCLLCVVGILACAFQVCAAENDLLTRMEGKVSRFTLDNGLSFVVIERHQAPVASFVTMVDVGSVDEPAGLSGLAHMLEHMAFKGTSRIGTTNWEAEEEVLDQLEQAYLSWRRAQKSNDAAQDTVQARKEKFERLREKAKSYVQPNEFASIIEANGGTDLNAATSSEYTMYFCSLPANRAELWFSLESERLRDPVWREFFTEKEVVLEERRMRVDSSPIGRMMERLLAASFVAHPYRNPVIGWESEIKAALPSDLTRLYEKYYVPENMVCAVAGDVDPEQIQAWAEEYFGALPTGPRPPEVQTKEPERLGTKQLKISSRAQPVLARTYSGVSRFHPQAPALELASDILSQGRTSRLYTSLVQKQELAAQVGTFSGYPADVDPGLFVLFALPNAGVSLDDLAAGIDEQLARMRTTDVSDQELKRVKGKARARLLRSLDSNLGLARSLAKAQLLDGDWREAFLALRRLEDVQPGEIRKAVRTYLDPDTRVEARLVQSSKPQGKTKN
jgi:predicted Zn-dependent peptidase